MLNRRPQITRGTQDGARGAIAMANRYLRRRDRPDWLGRNHGKRLTDLRGKRFERGQNMTISRLLCYVAALTCFTPVAMRAQADESDSAKISPKAATAIDAI